MGRFVPVADQVFLQWCEEVVEKDGAQLSVAPWFSCVRCDEFEQEQELAALVGRTQVVPEDSKHMLGRGGEVADAVGHLGDEVGTDPLDDRDDELFLRLEVAQQGGMGDAEGLGGGAE